MMTVGLRSLGLVLLLAGGALLWGSLTGWPRPVDVASYWGAVPLLLGAELLRVRWRAVAATGETSRRVRIRLHPGAVAALAVVLVAAVSMNAVGAFIGGSWWGWVEIPFGDITHPHAATATLRGGAVVGDQAREVVIDLLPGNWTITWTITGAEGPDIEVACDLTARARSEERAKTSAHEARVEITGQGDTIRISFSVPGFHPSAPRNDVSLRVEGSISVPPGLSLRVSGPAGKVALRGHSGDVDVNVAAGTVSLSDLGGSAHASVAAGEISARRVAGPLDVSLATGRVEISDPGASVTVDVAAGDCVVRSSLPLAGDWKVEVIRGNIEACFPRTSSVQVEAESFGAISCDLGFAVSPISGGNKLTGALGTGDYRMELSTRSGNIVITGTDTGADTVTDG